MTAIDVLPTFLVIGAAKSGTTALHHYLGQHPDLFLPRSQEPSFFAFEGTKPNFRGPNGTSASVNTGAVTDLDEYLALFAPGSALPGRGEVSPVYLYWPGTAERIRRRVPDVRLCVILRDPAERAYSSFMHARREGKEPLGVFEEALRAEPQRIAEGWGFLWRYADMGRYVRQLRRYYDVFPRSQICVVLYDDLQRDAAALCSRLQEFIGVDPAFVPDVTVRHNVSGLPKSRALHRALSRKSVLGRAAARAAPLVGADRLRRIQQTVRDANLTRIPFAGRLPEALRAEFDQEINELERLIGRDLSSWRG